MSKTQQNMEWGEALQPFEDCSVFSLFLFGKMHFFFVVGIRDRVTQQAQQVSTHLRIFLFSGPLPENEKCLLG